MLGHKFFNRKYIFFVGLIILSPFLLLLGYYIFYSQDLQKARYNDAAHSIVNAIHLATCSPKELTTKTLPPIHNVTMSFSKNPRYYWQWSKQKHNKQKTMSTVYNAVISKGRKGAHNIQLSYKLNGGCWLNITRKVRPVAHNLLLFILYIEFFSIFVIGIYLWMILRFRKPFSYLKQFANEASIDGMLNILPICGPKIARDVLQAVNKMQYRVKELLDQRKLTLSALSHDLCTPLTRLRLRAHILEDSKQRAKFLADIDEMEKMLNDTILFVKQEYLIKPERRRAVDIISLISVLCEKISDLGNQVDFNTHVTRFPFSCSPWALERAFSNLIYNAVKYGKVAHIAVHKKDKQLIITIDDEGPGLSPEAQKKVFDPFYRIDSSRSKKTGGFGLGLAIAKSIISSHKGTIEAINLPERGLRMRVVFKTD